METTKEVRTDSHLVVQEQCELLRSLVDVDAAVVTLVDAEREELVASSGRPEFLDAPLASDPAHCLRQDTVTVAEGTTVTVSVISTAPRRWTDRDRAAVETVCRTINHVLLAGETSSRSDRHEAAMTAHDLRTPLSVLVGAARRLAAAGEDDDEIRARLVTMVERTSTQLEELVNGLLVASTSVAGERPVRREPVDVGAVLADAAAYARDTHGIEVNVRADASSTVYSDAHAVHRIVQNLLDNALHHGRPPIAMAVETSPTCATISVSNYGEPLDPETRDCLFDPFKPGTSATSRTGLGLHIVWRLATALGGSVDAVDDDGRTTFRVELPQRAER